MRWTLPLRDRNIFIKVGIKTAGTDDKLGQQFFSYGFSLFKMSTQRVGILNYNPPASRVVAIVIRKNHLSIL